MTRPLRATGNYEAHPAGQYAARLIDYIELGPVETRWGTKTCVRLVFVTDAPPRAGGKPWYISRRFTASIHDSSALGQMLTTWRGPFSKDERRGFDAETLIGLTALIQIEQVEQGGDVFDRLASVVRLPKGMRAPPIPKDFIRAQDRAAGGTSTRRTMPRAETVPRPEEPSEPLDEDNDDLTF
jgi:hypothetical protein